MTPLTPHDIDCFCRTHWLRLCAAARHRGNDEHEAQDAVQEVFMRLVQQDKLIAIIQLSEPDQQIAILLTQLNWLLNNRWRNQHRQRRGGEIGFVSLQDEAAQHLEPTDYQTPVRILAAAWVHGIIEEALTRLRSEMPSADWRALEPALYHDTATKRTPQSGAFRVAVHRARQRLQWLITREVPGAANPADAAAQLLGALQ